MTVRVGRATITLAAGHKETVLLALNGEGRQLLAKYRSLPVRVTASVAGKVVWTATVRFRAATKTKKRERDHR